MDFDFRLGLIILLGGLWVYLLGVIRDLTVNDPTHPPLLFLAFVHFVVFVYLALALWSFYLAELRHFGGGPATADAGLIDVILFGTWPLVVVGLLASFLITKIPFPGAYKAFFVLFYAVGLACLAVLYFAVLRGTPIGVAMAAQTKALGLFFALCLPIGSFIYLLLASVVLADVQIRTDKEFYTAREEILLSVRAAGYVMRPTVTKISCGLFEMKSPGDVTVAVPPDKHLGSDLVEVEFTPQAIPVPFKHYHHLRVTRRSR